MKTNLNENENVPFVYINCDFISFQNIYMTGYSFYIQAWNIK